MRTMHLFSGAGGGLLADLILGHQPVCAVEWDEHACSALRERAAEGWFSGLQVHQGDIRDFDFSPWAGRVDCLAAGFPCQDISAAGRGTGLEGPRSGLVSEVFRGIDEINPGLVWLENSPRIRTKGRHIVITELVARGYSWRDGTLAASEVGAGHKRDRWWCLAANADGLRQLEQERDLGIDRQGQIPLANGNGSSPTNHLRHRLQVAVQRGGLSETDAATIQAAAGYVGAHHWSPPDAGVCRVVDGLAHRMDRIKCAGNGQVPLQAAAAFLILSQP